VQQVKEKVYLTTSDSKALPCWHQGTASQQIIRYRSKQHCRF